MAFVGSLGNIARSVLPSIGKSILSAVAPAAVDALKGIAGKGIDSLFEAGTKGLSGLLSKIPLIGSPLARLAEKYAPKLAEVAKNFLGGKLDQLLSKIVGQPTERPVPGAAPGTTVVTPPVTTRAGEIAANTPGGSAPASGSQASTGNSPSTGSAPAGGFPPYPKQPTDPKDLNQQNKYQEEMFNYQQAMQMMMQHWNMMTTTSKAAFEGTNKIIGNLPVR